MSAFSGVGHRTTIENVQEQQSFHNTATTFITAGQKRPYNHDTTHSALSHKLRRPFPLSSSGAPPRLIASKVTPLEPLDSNGLSHPSEYTQRKEISATPTPAIDPFLSLSHSHYRLPFQLVQNLSELGIKYIYPWQKQCLLAPGLLTGEKNLVYSAPTGGGKSLVADLLMLKKVIEDRDAKAMLVLPYVALVQEKVRWLRNVVQGIPREPQVGKAKNESVWRKRADQDTIKVVGLFGGSKIRTTWHDFDIGICTIEKANGLINTAIEDGTISKLQVVVIDELHMVDDDFRGYILELLVTKLRSLQPGQDLQIIGMSATLSNIDLLETWLDALSYVTHYRPVPIREHLVYEGLVYPAETETQALKTLGQAGNQDSQASVEALSMIHPSTHKELQNSVTNAVVALAHETATSGYGALVFSSSRAGCETDALLISRTMPVWDKVATDVAEKRADLIKNLRNLHVGLDRALEKTIPSGVAFHHAGLTAEERDLIANAYDSGVIKVCVATCSLAAGINLPARRVILHNARMGRDFVGPSLLRQMRGRAGRKGKDEVGETYLCCRPQDLEEVVDLLHAELPHISSKLGSETRRVQRAILEIVAIRLATAAESINEYMKHTLLRYSSDCDELDRYVQAGLEQLQEMGYIILDGLEYRATQLGAAVVASSLDPEDGLFIYKELTKCLQSFVLDGEMHVFYIFTPVNDLGAAVSWRAFRSEMEALDESGMRVLNLLGIKPTIINKMAQGGIMRGSTQAERDLARVYRRFYLALQLRDLCNEVPVDIVSKKYDMPRGTVQTLAQTCQGFAAGMVKFCELIGYGGLAVMLEHFSDRLRAGAKSDLLELTQIIYVKSRTARIFWENGFKTVAAVANAAPEELVPVLMQAQPNEIRLKGEEDADYEKLLVKAQAVSDSANRLWQVQMQQELDENEM